MTLDELVARVAALEAEVRELKARTAGEPPPAGSWLGTVGRFKDDPTFEEAVRLGREHRDQVNRESLEEFDREEAAAKAGKKKAKSKKSRTGKTDARA